MCYCRPDIRTPFCQNCYGVMYKDIQALKAENDELQEAVMERPIITKQQLDTIKNFLWDVAHGNAGNLSDEADAILADVDPVYCHTCTSCGVEECCPPDNCKFVQNLMCLEGVEKSIDKTCSKWASFNSTPNGFFVAGIKEDLRKLFSADGLYCETNWANYKHMEKQLNDFYTALETIALKTQGTFPTFTIRIASEVLTKYYGEAWKK